MICYLDTSALVKLYVQEPGSEMVRKLRTRSGSLLRRPAMGSFVRCRARSGTGSKAFFILRRVTWQSEGGAATIAPRLPLE
jgi:hypothetical protein